MKRLPIGIQTFERIINEGYCYIDKTRHLHDLVTRGSYYFLARPRRFGKSLLLSTLAALFKGKSHLFEGLWIYEHWPHWTAYPLIYLDFSTLAHRTSDELYTSLRRRLCEIGLEYEQDIPETYTLEDTLRILIDKLAAINPVVILIDEYDHPLVSHLQEMNIAQENRAILRSFFTVIKGQDAHLRFVFLTGVSKFSQVSVFSGLNNLKDITLLPRAASLLGYTEEEIKDSFGDRLNILAHEQNKTLAELLAEIRSWYNGYRFSPEPLPVYNPFSVLNYLEDGQFRHYWFETGTPTFLIHLMQKQAFSIQQIENNVVSELAFSSYSLEELQSLPLLFQTGYLTIKDYFPMDQSYLLDFPNKEVKTAFLSHLVTIYGGVSHAFTESHLFKMRHALNKGELPLFFQILRHFFYPDTLQYTDCSRKILPDDLLRPRPIIGIQRYS